MKPLDKGTVVKFKTKYFAGEGVVQPITVEAGYNVFEAFITGDDVKGISIVALLDTTICLALLREKETIERARKMISETGCYIVDEIPHNVYSPQCPY